MRSVLGTRAGTWQDAIGSIRSLAEATQGAVLSAGASVPDSDGKVVLYRTSWCGHCKRAAAHMQSKGIAFDERDIEKKTGYRAEYSRLGGKGGVPLIVFGRKTMWGFTPELFDRNYAEFQPHDASLPPAAASPQDRPVIPLPAAPASWQAGDTLNGKIAGVPIYRSSDKRDGTLAQMASTDAIVFMGEERDGMLRVTSSSGEGWVDRLLVRRP